MSYVTGISGNVISAASAAYAPTNSADVSAIASAYATGKQDALTFGYDDGKISSIDGSALAGEAQVVSAVGTETAYTPDGVGDVVTSINGNYISALSADYAYQAATDYLGRDLSGLPSEYDISSIASSYAESAASGKQDKLSFSYDDDKISAINGSALAGQGGGGLVTAIGTSESGITSLNNTGIVDTAALRSSDYSSLYVQEPLYISSTGDSAYIGISGIVDSASCSAIASAYATGKQDALTFGYDATDKISSIDGSALAGGGAGGDYVEKSATEVTIGSSNIASSTSFAQGIGNSAVYRSFAQGTGNTASYRSFAQGAENSAAYNSFALGLRNTASDTDFAQGYQNFASSRSFAQGYDNSASILSFAQGRNVSAWSAAAVFGQYNLHGNGNTSTGDSAAFAIGDGTASDARHDLMLVTKDGEITMYSSTADTVGTGIMSSIRAISAATGGIDSATCSAIASAYAESAVSSVSGNYYTTANESGYALSADVSGTVDLVSTQSANWGGSALALSAGPGVNLTKSGDTLIASISGPVYGEETIAGSWNGNIVYQMMLSGTGQVPGTSNIALPAELTSTSIARKWIDPSNSYILYGTTSNILPSTWVLGAGRYGSLNLIGVNVTMRSTDENTNTCSAFFNVKYTKAEA